MKCRVVFILIFFLIIGQLEAQIFPSDSIRFIRFIDSTENRVNIPLTKLLYLCHTKIGRDINSEFEIKLSDSLYDLIIIKSDPLRLPSGEWNNFKFGNFQLEIGFKKSIKKIVLDSAINNVQSIRLINDYATRLVNSPKIIFSGNIEFGENLFGKRKINGKISIISKNPMTSHEIIFRNAFITSMEYSEYSKLEKIEQEQDYKISQERLKKFQNNNNEPDK